MTSTEALFEPFERELLPDMIVNRLLTMIKERRLRPGDRLPPEREMAKMMGVGRPSLRAALRALAVMNIVEIRPGSGTYISSLRVDKIVERLDFAFSLDDSSISHLFEARRTLEGEVAALAAQHITDQELDRLDDMLEQMAELAKAGEGVTAAELEDIDREVHKLVAQASRNPLFYKFISILLQLAADSRRLSYSIPGAMERTKREHQKIVDALKKGDSDAARQAMLDHLQNAQINLLDVLRVSSAGRSLDRSFDAGGVSMN